jgi:VanZ family protein
MVAVLTAAIVIGSLVPIGIPGVEFGSDKFGHLFSYFVLALMGAGLVAAERVWIVMLRCLLLGLALEIAQGLWVESRQADWRDMVANAAGVAGAWLLIRGRSGWARYVEDWLLRR